jgi:ubiquinone/menaquinone biosynthesis C-methylase UbiE
VTNEIAAIGFAAAGSVYERGRPDYPSAVVAALTSHLDLREGSRLLDVATGTGKLARGFLGGPERFEVIAVEPAAEMRGEFARIQPGVPIVGSVAEALPFADGSIDAITVGTAFHWFDGPAALREFHRVLRPGAGLALVWLQRDESVPWVDELVRLVDTYRPADARRFAVTPWQAAFESAEARRLFSTLRAEQYPFGFPVDRATAVQRTASTSFVAAMPPERRAEVLARVTALIDAHPATRGLATIELPHVAELYWCERLG